MRNIFFVITLCCVVPLMTGCERLSSLSGSKFTVITDGNGKVVRLNTITGETCIVGENCDADFSTLIKGESYVYKGKGKFQHQKTIKWQDLK